jgi:hypothetical protein
MKYVFDIDPYDLNLKVFTSKLSLVKYLNKHGYQHTHNFDNVEGLSLLYEHYGIDLLLYLNKDFCTEDTLDHELIHITWLIARSIGHPLNQDNQEFQTYLFTSLKRKIRKKINYEKS